MPNTVYSVFRQNGTEFSITVPDTYKLTFGPTVPGLPRANYGVTPWCLRVYAPGKRLLAVYPDVLEFRSRDVETEYIERDENGVIIGRHPILLQRAETRPQLQTQRPRPRGWGSLQDVLGYSETVPMQPPVYGQAVSPPSVLEPLSDTYMGTAGSDGSQ